MRLLFADMLRNLDEIAGNEGKDGLSFELSTVKEKYFLNFSAFYHLNNLKATFFRVFRIRIKKETIRCYFFVYDGQVFLKYILFDTDL